MSNAESDSRRKTLTSASSADTVIDNTQGGDSSVSGIGGVVGAGVGAGAGLAASGDERDGGGEGRRPSVGEAGASSIAERIDAERRRVAGLVTARHAVAKTVCDDDNDEEGGDGEADLSPLRRPSDVFAPSPLSSIKTGGGNGAGGGGGAGGSDATVSGTTPGTARRALIPAASFPQTANPGSGAFVGLPTGMSRFAKCQLIASAGTTAVYLGLVCGQPEVVAIKEVRFKGNTDA